MSSPHGEHRPPPLARAAIARGRALRDGPLRKLSASALFRVAGGRQARPRDVVLFGDRAVRLHPYDNLCEKRTYVTPQFWDAPERAALAAAIAAGRDPFRFVDAGANVGLYTLFAESVAKGAARRLDALAIEPEPVVGARLAENLRLSGSRAIHRAAALTSEPCTVHLAASGTNRGENRIGAVGHEVPGLPLLGVIEERGWDHVDALKIDIEGHEPTVLAAFFAAAPRALWPRTIIMETAHLTGGHEDWTDAYDQRQVSRLNAVLTRRR